MSKNSYRVIEQEVEQLERRIRRHRWRVIGITILILVVAMGALWGMKYMAQRKSYTEYEVLESTERKDSAGTKFTEFNGNIIKYSNDGAFYINEKNQQIWNQTYEMYDPILDTCQEYVAIADRNGTRIYVMDSEKTWGAIETTMPIQQVHVAGQGTVAVLLEREGVGYIQLYDKKGAFLAEGAIHAQNSGYPLDIAISNDGKKMAVSMLDVSTGELKTTITFYNFGPVGQNEVDNIVSTYSYEGIVPRVEFLTNDMAVAVGEQSFYLFEGTQKPVLKEQISLERKIRSIFYDEEMLGFALEGEDAQNCDIELYNVQGLKFLELKTSMDYDKIEFLNNGELCIRNSHQCEIYTMQGVKRFQGEFEKDIYAVVHAKGRQYIFTVAGATEKIKLK